jgi:hypothetical protein
MAGGVQMSKTLRKLIRAIDVAKPKLHKIARELDVARKKSPRKRARKSR